MKAYRDRQTNHTAALNELRDNLPPDIARVTQANERLMRVGEIHKQALCQVNIQNFSCCVPSPPASALARLRRYIHNCACIGILTALCLVFMSPDMAATHMFLSAAIFSVLGVIAGALIYVLVSIVVSLVKIGLLLVAAVGVSGLVMRACTPTIGIVATEKRSAVQIGYKPQTDHGKQPIRLRQQH
jgi:hypothetical protein